MTAMLQFHHPSAAPTLDEAQRLFGLTNGQLDADFGVLATDPDAGLFTVLVADEAMLLVQAALALRPPHAGEGLFGNARIEPT
jgi:hypothetical protein